MKRIEKKYLNVCARLTILFVLSVNVGYGQDSQEILSEILRDSNSLSNNLSIEKRLEIFEKIQRSVQTILDNFPSSNEAINFLSRQSIGDFDLVDLQNQYIRELNDYYGKICTVDPSAECLAYVSLRLGSESCKKASTFDELNLAQVKIRNAIKTFAKSSDQIKNLALSEFRNCATVSALSNKSLLDDFFARQLVPVYLDLDEIDQATAIIQNIEDPYLTFLSVIELTRHNKDINSGFIRRINQYIDDERIRDTNFILSRIDINTLALEMGSSPNPLKAFDLSTFAANCRSNLDEFLILSKTIEYMEIQYRLDSDINKNEASLLSNHISQKCGNQEVGEALLGYVVFRAESQDLANQYIQLARTSKFDSREMQNFAFEIYQTEGFDQGGLPAYPFNDYTLLKIDMLRGNLCTSIASLFENFLNNSEADAQEVSDLLEFSLTTNLLESDQSCGDASLELLLQ